jgi:hypothetical protein
MSLLLQDIERLVYMSLLRAVGADGKAYASDPIENCLRQQNIMPSRNPVIEHAIQSINIG